MKLRNGSGTQMRDTDKEFAEKSGRECTQKRRLKNTTDEKYNEKWYIR